MKKNKLLAALMVCTLATMPVVLADVSVSENISGGSSLWGGAINNEVGNTVNISEGVIFSNNASTYQYQGGGAIYNQNKGIINIEDNVQFNNNSINNNSDAASAGGAIANWGSGTLNIGDNVKFEGNGSVNGDGWSCGGAIYSDSDRFDQANLTIKSNGKFYGNKTSYGGAMYLEGTNASIGTSEFKNNEAQRGSGGAISITGGKLGHVDSNGIPQNYPIVESVVNLTGKNTFFNNSAKTDGGAIRVNGQSTVSIDSTSVFEKNSASGNGGAISNNGYYEDEPYVPTPAKEEYISKVTADGVTFLNNSAKGNGGAIYNALTSSLETTTDQRQNDVVFNTSGTFTGNSATKGGAIYNDGTFNLGTSEFTNNKAQQGGAIYNAEAGLLKMSGVTINSASANAKNDVYNAGTIDLANKNVINSDLSGSGIINNNGDLTLGGNNIKFTGKYNTIADSITTVTGTYLGGDREVSAGTLNWYTSQEDALSGYLQVTGGKLNIGNKDSEIYAVLNIDKDSKIDAGVQTNLAEGSVLNIQNGGKVSLDTGDKWDGKIILGAAGTADNSTTLDVKSLNSTGALLANNGVLLISNTDLNIQGESYIEKAVAMETDGNISISNGGRVAIDDNDSLTGSVTLSGGGTLNYGKTTDSGLTINAQGGNLNLLANSNLIFTQGSIADTVAINIQEKANLKLAGSTLNLDSADQWNGNIINNGGTINANNLTKSSNTATLTQSDGRLNLYNDSNLVLGTESLISGGNITIKKGDKGTNGSALTVYGEGDKEVISAGNMTIDEYSKFVLGSGKFTIDTLSATAVQNPDGTIQAALVDVMNGEISESKIGSIILATGDDKISQANFNIDVLARSNKRRDNDTFVINSIADDATVYINQWGLGGDIYGWDAPIDRHIKLNDIFLDGNGKALLNNIEVTKDTTFTPIGWYQLNKNEEFEDIIDPATGLPMVDPATGMIMN